MPTLDPQPCSTSQPQEQSPNHRTGPSPAPLSIPVRLTRAEMEIVCLGLLIIDRNYQRWLKYGVSAFGRRRLPGKYDRELFNQQMAVLTKVRGLVCGNTQATRRLHLTAIELAACALALRVTGLWDRHKGVRWKRRNCRITLKHLPVKLENLRKVAKRLHIRKRGKADYDATHRRWREHLECMRALFVFAFWGHAKPVVYRRNTLRKMVMKDWVKWVHEQLRSQGLGSPPDNEIAEEVRKALYAARRLGVGYGAFSNPKQKRFEVDWFMKSLRKRIIAPARNKQWNKILDKFYAASPWLYRGGTDGEEEQGKVEEPARASSAPVGEKGRKG